MAVTFTFDGPNRTIYMHDTSPVDGIVSTFHVKDIYKAWKLWCTDDVGLQYPKAFDVIGGEPISNEVSSGSYFFMRTDYGWIGKPPEIDGAVLILQGNLYPSVVGDRVMDPLPSYTTTLVMQTSSLTETVHVGSSGGGSGLSDADVAMLQGLDAKIDELLDVNEGKWEIANNQMIFYRRDGTELIRYDLFDSNGNATSFNVVRREVV